MTNFFQFFKAAFGSENLADHFDTIFMHIRAIAFSLLPLFKEKGVVFGFVALSTVRGIFLGSVHK